MKRFIIDEISVNKYRDLLVESHALFKLETVDYMANVDFKNYPEAVCYGFLD